MGADIEGICRQASMLAIREFVENPPQADDSTDYGSFRIAKRHFAKVMEARWSASARSAPRAEALLSA